MKKPFVLFLLTAAFTLSLCTLAFADKSVNEGFISTAQASDGIVSVKYNYEAGSKVIKALVTYENTTRAQYTIKPNVETYLPLQMGKGKYSIALGEVKNGKMFYPIMVDEISISTWDERVMYTISHPIIDYVSSTVAIPAYKQLNEGQTYNKCVSNVYSDVVRSFSYDYEKASKVQSGYVPVIDVVYEAKMGICYDYSTVLAGALRSQGIPVKLLMGYAPEIAEYHAWNEILMEDGQWVVVDTTSDSAYDKANAQYTFAKDPSKYKITNQY
jgi:hypothetical protein